MRLHAVRCSFHPFRRILYGRGLGFFGLLGGDFLDGGLRLGNHRRVEVGGGGFLRRLGVHRIGSDVSPGGIGVLRGLGLRRVFRGPVVRGVGVALPAVASASAASSARPGRGRACGGFLGGAFRRFLVGHDGPVYQTGVNQLYVAVLGGAGHQLLEA